MASENKWFFLVLQILLVFYGCLLLTINWNFSPASDPQQGSGVQNVLKLTISAANKNHFFQFFTDNSSVGSSIRLSGHDIGMFYFPDLFILIAKHIRGADTIYGENVSYYVEYLIFVSALLLLTLPPVPFPLTVSLGYLIVSGFRKGYFNYGYYGYWAPALAIILVTGYITALPYLLIRTRTSLLTIRTIFLGLLLGILGTWRHDAELISLFTIISYVTIILLHFLISYWKSETPLKIFWTNIFKNRAQLLIYILLFAGSAYALKASINYHLHWQQKTEGIPHFSNQTISGHTLWHSIYLGLGWIPNNLGIKWDDSVGFEKAKSEDPSAAYLTNKYEKTMRHLFFKTISEHPMLFLNNIASKSKNILRLFGIIRGIILLMTILYAFFFARLFPKTEPTLYSPFVFAAAALFSLLPSLLTVPDASYALAYQALLFAIPLLFLASFSTNMNGGLLKAFPINKVLLESLSISYLVIYSTGFLIFCSLFFIGNFFN